MYYVLFYLREYTARKIFVRIESEEKKTDDDTFLNFFESSCTKLAPKQQHIIHDYVKERKESFFFRFFSLFAKTVTVIE